MSDKSRKWTLNYIPSLMAEDPLDVFICQIRGSHINYGNEIHVVDIEALRKVEAERDELKTRVGELEEKILQWRDGHEHVVHQMSKEIDELKRQLAESLCKELNNE